MRLLALLLVAGCATQTIPERVGSPIVAYPFSAMTVNRPDVAAAFDALLRKAAWGHLDAETAGFLIFDGERFHLELWPPTRGFHSAEWVGRIPDGTVAVVHTHPPDLPAPSVQDRIEAQRIGIPIIVVTTSSVVMATEGGAVRVLSGRLR